MTVRVWRLPVASKPLNSNVSTSANGRAAKSPPRRPVAAFWKSQSRARSGKTATQAGVSPICPRRARRATKCALDNAIARI